LRQALALVEVFGNNEHAQLTTTVVIGFLDPQTPRDIIPDSRPFPDQSQTKTTWLNKD
jgi:hypothetical protein